jgi:hypothetical protein
MLPSPYVLVIEEIATSKLAHSRCSELGSLGSFILSVAFGWLFQFLFRQLSQA